MTVKTSAGTLLHVFATAPATFDSLGYAALAWVAVGEITDLGEFGRHYNLVSHTSLALRSTQKFKGSFNEGTIALKLGLDTKDAGQIMMKTAVLSDLPYSFRITTQNGDKYYVQAQVMAFGVVVGSLDQITSAAVTLELTSSNTGVGIVEVIAP